MKLRRFDGDEDLARLAGWNSIGQARQPVGSQYERIRQLGPNGRRNTEVVGGPYLDVGQAVGVNRRAIDGAYNQLELGAVQELWRKQFERRPRWHRDIQADSALGAAGVDAAVAEGRAVPALAGRVGSELKGLVAGQFPVSARGRLH